MKFWDSSALVSLFLQQAESDKVRATFSKDKEVMAWILSDLEFRSALCRLLREGFVSAPGADTAWGQFQQLWTAARLVVAVDPVKERARRLVGVHPLRAADALQLGAALVAVYDQPLGSAFVTLDTQLAEAARREGFQILP